MSRNIVSRAGYLTHSARTNLIANDEFPILDFKEISQCLTECDFDASEELVTRPSSSYIRQLFEQILDTFIGLSTDYCGSTTKSLLKKNNPAFSGRDISQDASEDYGENDDTADSVGLVVFFRAVNMFLKKCGIQDFTLMDLVRPDSLRIQRVLSGIVNFARFREEHLRECENLAKESEEKVQEIRNIEDQNVNLAKKIERLNGKLQEEPVAIENMSMPGSLHKSTLSQLHKFNSKLEQELIKLQKSQEVFKREHISYKETKARLIEKLEDQYFLLNESERDLNKIENYASADPEVIKKVVSDLKVHSQNAEEQLRKLETEVRNKTRTHQSIQVVEDELRNLIKIVQEISNDLKSLANVKESFAEQTDELNKKRQASEELKVYLERLLIKLQNSEEKITNLRQQAKEKEEAANEKYRKLKQAYEMVTTERITKREKLAAIRKANSEIEAQIEENKLGFEREYRNTMTAVTKITAHIQKYLTVIAKYL